MQEERLCVLCPRSVHRRRQNHVLQASLLHTHPAHVSYIQENAIRQVSFIPFIIINISYLNNVYLTHVSIFNTCKAQARYT